MRVFSFRRQLLVLLGFLLAISFSSLLILSREALIYPATDQMAQVFASQIHWLRFHCGETTRLDDCASGLEVTAQKPRASSTLPLAYHDRLRQSLGHQLPEIDGIIFDETGGRLWLHTSWSDPWWLGFPLPDFAAKVRTVTGLLLVFSFVLVVAVACAYGGYLNRTLRRLSMKLTALSHNQPTGPPLRQGPREMRLLGRLLDQLSGERLRLQKARTLMLLGISHDLRAPLARLSAATSLLEEGELRHGIEQDLEEVGQILEQFQAFVHHAPSPLSEGVDLVALVLQVTQRYRSQGMDVHCLSTEKETMMVKATPLAIQRILENLLQNALKHGSPPVLVNWHRRQSHIEVIVRDHGQGVPDGALETVVEPFVQIEPARGGSGSGLGLAIVQQELVRLGGALHLQNHPLGGLQVSFSLPAVCASHGFRQTQRSLEYGQV